MVDPMPAEVPEERLNAAIGVKTKVVRGWRTSLKTAPPLPPRAD